MLATNETERYDITGILLTIALNTIHLTLKKCVVGEKIIKTNNVKNLLFNTKDIALVTPTVTFAVTSISTTAITSVLAAMSSFPVSSSEDSSPCKNKYAYKIRLVHISALVGNLHRFKLLTDIWQTY